MWSLSGSMSVRNRRNAVELPQFGAGSHESMAARRCGPKRTGIEAQRRCGAPASAVRTASGMGRPGVRLRAHAAAVRGVSRCGQSRSCTGSHRLSAVMGVVFTMRCDSGVAIVHSVPSGVGHSLAVTPVFGVSSRPAADHGWTAESLCRPEEASPPPSRPLESTPDSR